eukprot:Protomagalhaensia_wolfi_Nauph_80__910@NODE_1524_length_1489_cov_7_452414_g1183_i0_p1_GENE_NODE_1524_length_1489_cov_7_452414_g1183_i0NODE_1524_length_1489_cov_7_452414_g1183_i0_p1_ORF_typecomplete_len196_score4_26_NODE_1524_length_1489_cov_7_452414_g1183_i05971184
MADKGKLAWWAMCLSEYQLCIRHTSGSTTPHVDALSRVDPCPKLPDPAVFEVRVDPTQPSIFSFLIKPLEGCSPAMQIREPPHPKCTLIDGLWWCNSSSHLLTKPPCYAITMVALGGTPRHKSYLWSPPRTEVLVAFHSTRRHQPASLAGEKAYRMSQESMPLEVSHLDLWGPVKLPDGTSHYILSRPDGLSQPG